MKCPSRCPKCGSNFIYDDYGETSCICGKRFYQEPLPFLKYNVRIHYDRHLANLKGWETRHERNGRMVS